MRFTFDPAETGWTTNLTATIVDGTLRMLWGVGSDPTCNRTITGLVNGQTYALWVRVNMDGMPTSDVGIRILYNEGNGGEYLVTRASVGAPGSQVKYLGVITGAASDRLLRINGTHASGFLGLAFIEDVWVGEDPQEVLMARSTALPFMDRLKTLIEAIDPNIGKIYVTPKRWPTVERLENEGTLRINASGLFDDSLRIGLDVTRFWWMRPRIDCQPLTNGSAEYTTTIELMGFYQHEDGDAQFTALNAAAIEILDALNTKVAELETLNTGDAYLGFLLARPRMEAVQHAQLESPKVVGNSVQITVSFAEEVSFA